MFEKLDEIEDEKNKKIKFFNATITEINNFGLMKIKFDEKVNWNTTP